MAVLIDQAVTLQSQSAVTGDTYAWSHAMSGDYLFAYDQELCAEQSVGDTASPEFFSCMRGLGSTRLTSSSKS